MPRREPLTSAPRRLTRRAVLRRLLVSGGALLLALRASGSAEAQRLGEGVAAHRLRFTEARALKAAGGRRAVARLDLPRPACLVGLRWDGEVAPAELRARRAGGGWTPWLPITPSGHAPDGVEVRTSDPVWVGAARALEVRAPGAVAGLVACTVERGIGPVRRTRSLLEREPTAPNGVLGPEVIPRSVWTNGRLKPREDPELGEVLAAIVHHTASLDDYGPEDSAGMVEAICRFHRNVSKWSDIGYHFLVDRYGQVFEGRAGGLDQPLVGAHAFGANRQTVGIAVLGTFSNVQLDDIGLEAVARCAAWKLSIHGAPVEGTVTLIDGADQSERELERIAGHRDWNATRCPGRALYDSLDDVRARALRMVDPPPSLSLTASAARVAAGATVRFAGHVTDDGLPAAWRRLALVRAEPKPATGLGFVTTDGNGDFGVDLALADGGSFEVRLSDGTGSSAPVQVLVEPRVRMAVRARDTEQGRGLRAQVWVRPHVRAVILDVHHRVDGRWRRVVRWRVRLRNGACDLHVPVPGPGRYRVRVTAAQSGRLAAVPPAQALVRVPPPA
jgi:hypothetical protein